MLQTLFFVFVLNKNRVNCHICKNKTRLFIKSGELGKTQPQSRNFGLSRRFAKELAT